MTIRHSAKRRWKFRLLAMLLAFMPFALIEICLQLAAPFGDENLSRETGQPSVPFFRRDTDSGRFVTSLPYQQYFAETSFTRDENHNPENKLAFVLGGSTVQGRPFAPETAFPYWTELLLNESTSDSWQVVNCGGVSFGSRRLSVILPELLKVDPDVIVIATGHNEFLEDQTYVRSNTSTGDSNVLNALSRLQSVRLVRSWFRNDAAASATDEVPEVNHVLKAKLDNDAGYDSYHFDSDWHDQVLLQFQQSVSGMLQQCQAAHVPVIVVGLAGNTRDCAPFKSEHSPPLNQQQRITWEQQAAAGLLAMQQGDWNAAIPELRACLLDSPRHALTHFRLARCLSAIGDSAAAAVHYQEAVDLDVCPLRMKSSLKDVLVQSCEDNGAVYLDCDELFRKLLPKEAELPGFGFDLFLDHVHPNVWAHQHIAIKLANRLAIAVGRSPQEPAPAVRTSLFQDHIDTLPVNYFTNGRRRIGWLEHWARAELGESEIVPMFNYELAQHLRRSLELRDNDRSLAQLALLLKEPSGSQYIRQIAAQFAASGQTAPTEVLSPFQKRDGEAAPAKTQLLSNETRKQLRQP